MKSLDIFVFPFILQIWYQCTRTYTDSKSWACTGFDRGLEDGEAIRRLMRQITNLKLNANDNYELAAA